MSTKTIPIFDCPKFPLLTLLHPREQSGLMAGALAAGLAVGWWGMNRLDWPLWIATATVLAFLLTSSVLKWQADQRRYGPTAMGVSALVVLQGFHAVEHIVQWFQYYTLNWSLRASTGLLSPANAEWVHFVWNWLVVLIVILLIWAGCAIVGPGCCLCGGWLTAWNTPICLCATWTCSTNCTGWESTGLQRKGYREYWGAMAGWR